MSARAVDLLIVADGDNVATALHDIVAGFKARVAGPSAEQPSLLVVQEIRLGHKAALRPIANGDLVIKHGRPIGHATADIAAGEHVHVHNVISLSRETDLVPAGETQEWH
jgi:SAF domain